MRLCDKVVLCALAVATLIAPPSLALHDDDDRHNHTEMLFVHEGRLLKTLFRGYVSGARPVRHLGACVDVKVDMMIMKINQLVERDQEIIVTGYLKIAWRDERLEWEPSQFGGIEWVVVPAANIWIPDIGLINSAGMYTITRDFHFSAVVDNNGNVMWVPAGKFVARCELDVTYFPFDNQTCFYRFESWSYSIEFLNITGQVMALSPAHYVPDQQWNITAVQTRTYVVAYENGAYSFSRIDFILRLHRKSLYYLTYTILPAVVLSFLQVLSHILPVTDSNRIGFSTTMLIAFSVLQVSIADQMPKTSDAVPLIATYVYVVMFLIALSLIEAFFTAHCLTKTSGTCPPKWMWIAIVEILGRFVVFPTESYQPKFHKLGLIIAERTSMASLKFRIIKRRLAHSASTRSANHLISEAEDEDDNSSISQNEHTGTNQVSALKLLMPLQARKASLTGCSLCQSMLPVLCSIQSDVTLLRRLCDDMADRQLKELSQEVWYALLSVVDRYIFLTAIGVAILTPSYLFLVLPPSPERALEP